jgi:hypothetical protein
VRSSQGTNGVPNFGIDGCPGVRPPVASVGESEAPSTPTESAKSLRKRPLFHLAGRAPLPARKTPSRVIALSPMQSRAVRRVGDECDRLQRRAIRATRAGASRGRMPETPREQVSALPAVGTGRHSGRCFIGSPSHSPTSSEPPPGSHCDGRSGSADATRRRCWSSSRNSCGDSSSSVLRLVARRQPFRGITTD